MKLSDHKKKAMKDPAFKAEYERYDLALEISQMVMGARIENGMSQEELASKAGILKYTVGLIEGTEVGDYRPSLKVLDRLAKALGRELHVHLVKPKK